MWFFSDIMLGELIPLCLLFCHLKAINQSKDRRQLRYCRRCTEIDNYSHMLVMLYENEITIADMKCALFTESEQ